MDQGKAPENAAGKGLRYLRERGLKEFSAHAVEKVKDGSFDYQKWLRRQQISPVQAGYQRKLHLAKMPRVFFFLAGADPSDPGKKDNALRSETIRSVKASTYPKVFLIQALHSQIRDEDFITYVREGDLIDRSAVFEMVQALQDGADAVYTDEDSYRKRETGRIFSDPLFKPDFNPDYLRSTNYIGRLFLVRVGIVRSFYLDGNRDWIPTPRRLADPAYCYAMVLRCTRMACAMGGVKHVPKVLCHILRTEEKAELPDAEEKAGLPDAEKKAELPDVEEKAGLPGTEEKADLPEIQEQIQERMRAALREDLAQRGLKGGVEDGPLPGTFHIAYEIPSPPSVSIVIPSRDNASVLENCILSIRSRSTWDNYEIIVVENNSVEERTFELYRSLEESSRARIVKYPDVFHFSRVVNEGVKNAGGEYIILMNNDVTVKTPDWIERLLAHVERPEVGAAGPKLLYPDGRVQSAGIVTGIMGFAGSMMVAEDGDAPGYMGRAVLTQDLSAVTGACMMVKRKAFLEAGGFPDEFSVALGDVDFCLSLGKKGYRIVFEPSALMIHHESLTRGAEDSKEKKKRFARERALFCKKHARLLKEGDPAYNPNLSRRRCDWSQQT